MRACRLAREQGGGGLSQVCVLRHGLINRSLGSLQGRNESPALSQAPRTERHLPSHLPTLKYSNLNWEVSLPEPASSTTTSIHEAETKLSELDMKKLRDKVQRFAE